jgi:F-type H+-transporting ATPase subunit k
MFFIGGYAALGAAAILKPAAPMAATPPIQASSVDEEAFIKEFLANAEVEEKKN